MRTATETDKQQADRQTNPKYRAHTYRQADIYPVLNPKPTVRVTLSNTGRVTGDKAERQGRIRRQSGTPTDKRTHRSLHRQRHIGRPPDGHTGIHKIRHTDKHILSKTKIQTSRQQGSRQILRTGRQTDGRPDIQTQYCKQQDRQTQRYKARYTHTESRQQEIQTETDRQQHRQTDTEQCIQTSRRQADIHTDKYTKMQTSTTQTSNNKPIHSQTVTGKVRNRQTASQPDI